MCIKTDQEKWQCEPGVVAYVHNPAFWGEGRRTKDWRPACVTYNKTLSQRERGEVVRYSKAGLKTKVCLRFCLPSYILFCNFPMPVTPTLYTLIFKVKKR